LEHLRRAALDPVLVATEMEMEMGMATSPETGTSVWIVVMEMEMGMWIPTRISLPRPIVATVFLMTMKRVTTATSWPMTDATQTAWALTQDSSAPQRVLLVFGSLCAVMVSRLFPNSVTTATRRRSMAAPTTAK